MDAARLLIFRVTCEVAALILSWDVQMLGVLILNCVAQLLKGFDACL